MHITKHSVKEKVLVTGGCGYIGGKLVPMLCESGYDVTVVDNLMYEQGNIFHNLPRESVKFIKADARYPSEFSKAIRNAKYIIPLAAIVGAPACDKDPQLATEVNVDAIVRLLQMIHPGGHRVIFPTTNSGYGTRTGESYCTEETPLEPISHYGITKKLAEEAVLKFQNSVVLRLATVFGYSPRMRLDLMVNDFIYKCLKEGELKIFEPHFKRNFVSIRDVGRAFIHCMRTRTEEQMYKVAMSRPFVRPDYSLPWRVATGVYNLGNDKLNMNKGELAQLIASQCRAYCIVPPVVSHMEDSDPDKRDYIVSSDKITNTGFECCFSIEDELPAIERFIRFSSVYELSKCRNV